MESCTILRLIRRQKKINIKNVFYIAGDYLLVTTGHDGSNRISDTQVISLKHPSRKCQSIQDYPAAMTTGSVGILDKNILVCGGISSSNERLKSCHTFDTDAKQWKLFGNMTFYRESSAIAKFPNGSLWITGRHFH